MELDQDFTLRILETFEDALDAFMPVALIASEVNDDKNLEEEGIEKGDDYTLSNKFVFHMLHLQDLDCILNMRDEPRWGYIPVGQGGSKKLSQLIDDSLNTGKFETPHCYNATTLQSIIRLSATGIQMRTALQSETTSTIKKAVLEFGKLALPTALGSIIGAG